MQIISDTCTTFTVRVETPDGTLFVHIDEDEDEKPFAIRINIGKVGSRLMAWATCVADLVSLGFDHKANIYEILQILSGISSDKLVYSSGIPITSGPDGLVQAILIYLKEKDTDERKPRVQRRPEARSES